MTDGSAWRQEDPAWQQPHSATTGSPWWSDALSDPWRDPWSPAVVVHRLPAEAPVEPEPLRRPEGVRLTMGPVVVVAVVAALLAGALGGTLGYVFAAGRPGGRTVLGAAGSGVAPLAQRSPQSLAAAVRRVLPSVVTIQVNTVDGSSLGSGFVASADGYIVTNDHVISGATGGALVTFNDASTATARVVGSDPESDVAVIKVDRTGLTPVEFGNSDQVAVGDPVLAVGSPLALSNTVTSGIVSAVDRPIEAAEPGGPTRYYAAIQTDAAVNHGNSGGPLVDGAGRVIGINSVIKSVAASDTEAGSIGLAFAIPINQAERVVHDIIDIGHARRTVIGAQLDSGYRSVNGGVRLLSVVSGGPAAKAGLRAGDVIMKLNTHPLEDPTDLIALVRKYPPGAAVGVVYQRGGAQVSVEVTLAADAN